jgi:hypothetical protein
VDVAASGGYYLAVAGDEIYADPSSIVGSIGVIFSSFGFDKAIEKLGIERRVYTSGERKVMLDPFLPENPEDVQRLKDELVEEKGDDYLAENDGWWEAEARSRADNGYTDAAGVRHPPAPRAIERYERAMEELRKMSYEEGLVFRESMGTVIPESVLVELRNEAARAGAGRGLPPLPPSSSSLPAGFGGMGL